MYMPDPEAALVAMARCLRPGGRIAVSVWGERRDCGWAAIFSIVDARVRSEVPTTLHYAQGDAACDAAFLSGPVALEYSRFDEATRLSVRAEYLASIEPWRVGERYAIPGTFVIGSGQRPAFLRTGGAVGTVLP